MWAARGSGLLGDADPETATDVGEMAVVDEPFGLLVRVPTVRHLDTRIDQLEAGEEPLDLFAAADRASPILVFAVTALP